MTNATARLTAAEGNCAALRAGEAELDRFPGSTAEVDITRDAAFVERLRRQEPAAFAELVAQQRDRLRTLAARLGGWPADVDDLVQEIFLAIYRALPQFRGQSQLSTWMTTIAIHKCRSHARRRRLGDRVLKLLHRQHAAGGARHQADRSDDREHVHADRLARLHEGLKKLAARDREVIVLRYLEALSIEAIAELLNLSRGAVEVRLTRARRRLEHVVRSAAD